MTLTESERALLKRAIELDMSLLDITPAALGTSKRMVRNNWKITAARSLEQKGLLIQMTAETSPSNTPIARYKLPKEAYDAVGAQFPIWRIDSFMEASTRENANG